MAAYDVWNPGYWWIRKFLNNVWSPPVRQQMKMCFNAGLTGSAGSPNFGCNNETACHSKLIYSLSLKKAWHKVCRWNCFCLRLNCCHQLSQTVQSLCASGCMLIVMVSLRDTRKAGQLAMNKQHIIVFASCPLPHSFPSAAPGIVPFHFLSLYVAPCPRGFHLFWLSPSLIPFHEPTLWAWTLL